jgi:nucleotide-binding universal stress UspA family protein
MQLYRKILLTIDCSDVDKPIVEHVSALARQNDATVVLMHVIHAHTLDQDRALREKAAAAMAKLLSTMEEAGVNAISSIKSGEPEKVLLQEIENGSYDLVAMATHGHTFLGDILFGSVSDSLKHKISVPLLLLRSE